jgi:biopolymer transport protein ExbB
MLELKPAIEEAGSRELDRLEKPNHGLAILAAVGPMLGLLGTVIGMIGAFAEIGSASGIAKNEELARYMSLALVCTAEGLIVAIPCTFAYALFKRRTDRLVAEVGDVAERLAGQFSGKHAAAKPVAGAAPRPAAATGAA